MNTTDFSVRWQQLSTSRYTRKTIMHNPKRCDVCGGVIHPHELALTDNLSFIHLMPEQCDERHDETALPVKPNGVHPRGHHIQAAKPPTPEAVAHFMDELDGQRLKVDARFRVPGDVAREIRQLATQIAEQTGEIEGEFATHQILVAHMRLCEIDYNAVEALAPVDGRKLLTSLRAEYHAITPDFVIIGGSPVITFRNMPFIRDKIKRVHINRVRRAWLAFLRNEWEPFLSQMTGMILMTPLALPAPQPALSVIEGGGNSRRVLVSGKSGPLFDGTAALDPVNIEPGLRIVRERQSDVTPEQAKHELGDGRKRRL